MQLIIQQDTGADARRSVAASRLTDHSTHNPHDPMSENNQLAVFQKPADLMAFLQRGKSAVEMALPKHLNPDRMLRLALTCFSTTPKLRQCTGQSILASIVVASQLGLEPGVTGQGYLIPYKTTCTFVPGWQGLVGLLNNSGRATAWTGAVFEGDVWDFQLGSAPRCAHVPGPNFGDASKMIWVYACGKVNGSEQPVVEAWPIARVWKHRDRFNKVGQQHYSYQHPEMYARKVVLLQVLKYMPRSIELNNAMTAANAADAGIMVKAEDGVIIEIPEEEAPPAIGRIESSSAPTEEPAQSSSAPAPSDADKMREALLKEAWGLGADEKKLVKVLIAMRLIEPSDKFAALDVAKLAEIVARWDEEETGVAARLAAK